MTCLINLLFHDVYEHSPDESGFRSRGADRYKLTLLQFKRQLRSIDTVRADPPALVTDPGWAGASLPFTISVDDGGLSYHSMVAPALAAHGWLGHCLVTTDQLGQRGFLHPHHVRELHEAGHLIGSHSATHPLRIDACTWEEQVAEWSRSKAELEQLIGSEITVGSVPGGFYTRRVAMAARAAGLDLLLTSEPKTAAWTVDGCRALGRYTIRRDSPPELAGRLVRRRQAARLLQWTTWNAKKALKKSLGDGYVRLADRIAG